MQQQYIPPKRDVGKAPAFAGLQRKEKQLQPTALRRGETATVPAARRRRPVLSSFDSQFLVVPPAPVLSIGISRGMGSWGLGTNCKHRLPLGLICRRSKTGKGEEQTFEQGRDTSIVSCPHRT